MGLCHLYSWSTASPNQRVFSAPPRPPLRSLLRLPCAVGSPNILGVPSISLDLQPAFGPRGRAEGRLTSRTVTSTTGVAAAVSDAASAGARAGAAGANALPEQSSGGAVSQRSRATLRSQAMGAISGDVAGREREREGRKGRDIGEGMRSGPAATEAPELETAAVALQRVMVADEWLEAQVRGGKHVSGVICYYEACLSHQLTTAFLKYAVCCILQFIC